MRTGATVVPVRRGGRWFRIAGWVMGGTMALAVAASVSAAQPQTDVFEQAVPLAGTLSGHLEQSTGGRFAYYRFSYPGDGSTATVNVQVTPDDPRVLNNVGIKVYGPKPGREYFVGGQQPGLRPNISGNIISTDPNDRGTYTVQVYSYDQHTPIDFTIWVTGLAEPPTPVPTPAPPAPPATEAPPPPPADVATATPAAETSAPPAATSAASPTTQSGANSYSSHLGAAGQTAVYEFNYPGDRSVYTISLKVRPDDAAVLKNAGFRVFGPGGERVYLVGTARPGSEVNVVGDLIAGEEGRYTVQVYNDDPSTAIEYEIGLIAGPPRGETSTTP